MTVPASYKSLKAAIGPNETFNAVGDADQEPQANHSPSLASQHGTDST